MYCNNVNITSRRPFHHLFKMKLPANQPDHTFHIHQENPKRHRLYIQTPDMSALNTAHPNPRVSADNTKPALSLQPHERESWVHTNELKIRVVWHVYTKLCLVKIAAQAAILMGQDKVYLWRATPPPTRV